MKKVFLIVISVIVLCKIIAQNSSSNRLNQFQQGQRHQPPSFKELLTKMDANKDGKLSKSEIKGPLLENFEKVDTNKDGFITEEEFKKAPKPQTPRNGSQGRPEKN